MPDTRPDYERQWHLDKRFPVALILTILGQTIAVVWWAASLSQRVDQLERAALAASPRLESIIRLEAKMENVQSTLIEIKAALSHK